MFIKALNKYALILLILIRISFETPEDTTLIKDYLVCRNCGADVSLTNFFVNKLSPSAIASVNTTLFGEDVLIQEFVNPINHKFIVVLLKRASCSRVELWVAQHTWFPGYAWKLCLCPSCGEHIGWQFEPLESASKDQTFPSEQGFYALIVDNVVAENNLNSLLRHQKLFT